MDKAAPILIDNAEEWEAGQILDYCRQNNRNEFRDHWKPYERADHSWEHIKNLDHSMELIQQYSDANPPAEPTPQITSNYINASWDPMQVSSTARTATDYPDDFWEPYEDEEYDSSTSEQDYVPTDDHSLPWHTDDSAEDGEDFGIMVALQNKGR